MVQSVVKAPTRVKLVSTKRKSRLRESVIQSEVSQKEKNKYHMLTYLWNLKKNVMKNLGARWE